jgi:hypothetical protein
MAHISYDIIYRNGGWRVVCGEVVGSPYYRKMEAVQDVKFSAKLLQDAGNEVSVQIEGAQSRN